MKFLITLVCLAAKAMPLQHSLLERDLTTVTSVLEDVKSNLQNLSTTVKTSTDDPGPLLISSNNLIASLESGKIKVDGTAELSFLDDIALIRPVQDMTNLGSSLTNNLKAIMDRVERLNECDVFRLQVASVTNSSQALITSVNGKIPDSAREISKQLTAKLTQVLQQSQDEFSEHNCQNGRSPAASPSNSISAGAAGPATFALSRLLALAVVALIV